MGDLQEQLCYHHHRNTSVTLPRRGGSQNVVELQRELNEIVLRDYPGAVLAIQYKRARGSDDPI